jgi:tRNA A-37 threonylcarbamoyl transferase component Bud32
MIECTLTVQQIGRYQIIGELGRGTMGIVYRAQDPAIGRTIAIKTIDLNQLAEPAERERLRNSLFREAQSAGILSHPNIVTIYDISEEGGLVHIFMEFVNGPSVAILSAKTPGKATLLGIFRQTATALDYAHKKGVIHRDIKPTNIMIHEGRTAKITDFGVAKFVSQELTVTSNAMGATSYMAPEQIDGSAITGRTDQFSLAVTVYEVLTGENPLIAGDLFGFHRRLETPQAQHSNASLGTTAAMVFRKALAHNPADRYETCSEFISALSAAYAGTPGSISSQHGGSQTRLTGATQEDGLETPATLFPRAKAGALLTDAPLPGASQFRRLSASALITRKAVIGLFAAVLIGAVSFLVYEQHDRQRPLDAPASSPAASPALVEPEIRTPARDAKTQAPPSRAKLPAAQTEGAFELTTIPTGAATIFDGDAALKCVQPCRITLPIGRHTFVVESPGYRDAQRIIEVPRDKSLTVTLEKMSGMLILTTNPPGLTIVIDGQEQARKSPATFMLSTGAHAIDIVRGAERHPLSVEIRDGATIERTVDLSQ